MAAYLNRSISLMSGDVGAPHNRSFPLAGGGASAAAPVFNGMAGGNAATIDARLLRQTPDASPLQTFVNAKRSINEIFVRMDTYVREAVDYIHDIIDIEGQELISVEQVRTSRDFIGKVHGIKDVLSRDHMKVAFFGRTSNGKSSVINAMLREKILPSGIGHTTNCFLQVEGSSGDEPYVVLVDGNTKEKRAVESVGQLASALSDEKLSESEMVHVFWPRNRCFLLRDDVVFVDSPGVDVSPNLDEWIDKYCLDADVFVLVANAESTLMVTEKNFFHKVSTRLSKPNVFILNNRWDASADSDFLDEVRKQHQERAVDFLVKELKVCSSQKEAESRIFFISAKEVLQARLAEQGHVATTPLTDGFQSRYFEFENFERKFEECISQSAVRTKFEAHSQRGKHIARQLSETLDSVYTETLQLHKVKTVAKQSCHGQIESNEQQLIQTTQEMKQKIHTVVEDVEQRVSKALTEEIRRLSQLVDEFRRPFHADAAILNVYKRELHTHVEAGLGTNLRQRLSSALTLNVEHAQRDMITKMDVLIPDKSRLTSLFLPQKQPFEVLYRLNCNNLCADFREDLEFHFSWGITMMVQRFVNSHQQRRHILTKSPTSTVAGNNGVLPLSVMSAAENFSLVSRVLSIGGCQSGVAGLMVGGFLFKTVGWRVIAITGAIYGALYMYERCTWTQHAKERAFKRQYVQHATRKLRMIVDLTSANCSHQVQQELSGTFARLCHLVDDAAEDLDEQLKRLNTEIQTLETAAANAKLLRNKANYLIHELDLFEEAFTKSGGGGGGGGQMVHSGTINNGAQV